MRFLHRIAVAASTAFALCSCNKDSPTKADLDDSASKVQASVRDVKASVQDMNASVKELAISVGKVSDKVNAFDARKCEPLKWAVVDGNRVDSAISEWNSAMNSKLHKEQPVPPELAEPYAKYLELSRKLERMRQTYALKKRQEIEKAAGGGMNPGMWMGPPIDPREDDNDDPAYQKLLNEMNVARVKIAPVLDRQNVPFYTSKYKKEDLIREYAKGRYELIVDIGYGRNNMVYSTSGQQTEVTDAVIDLFRNKQDR